MGRERQHSKAHPGVSIQSRPNGTHRIRWREKQSDGSRRDCGWVVEGTAAEAEAWALKVFGELRTEGTVDTSKWDGTKPIPTAPDVADLRDVIVEWVAWRIENEGDKPGTVAIRNVHLRRLETHLRAVCRLDDDSPIPVTLLTEDTVGKLRASMAAGIAQVPTAERHDRNRDPASQATIRRVLSDLYGLWTWAAGDRNGRWGSLPQPPQTRRRIVPKQRTKGRPLRAPTWSEVRTIIGATTDPVVRDVFTIAACTGLRRSQVERLQVGDVDLERMRLEVRPELGKSSAESEGRTVPLADALRPMLARLVAGRADDRRLIGDRVPHGRQYKAAMLDAEEAGLPAEVWRADRRGNARISHWARAGFQAVMREAGVPENVTDALVGHAPSTVRDRHYVPPGMREMRDAVAHVPSVDVDPTPDNVIPLHHAG